jgi:hypothetical protein
MRRPLKNETGRGQFKLTSDPFPPGKNKKSCAAVLMMMKKKSRGDGDGGKK